MGVEIVTMSDCASNYGTFIVQSKTDKTKTYDVTFNGSEGPFHCTCEAFRWGKGKECKHIKQVFEEACLFNPQWKDGKTNPKIRPTEYVYTKFTGEKCRFCRGPMVFVKRAI